MRPSALSTNQIIAIIGGAIVLLVLLCFGAMWVMFSLVKNTTVVKAADITFGDQHLKTVVALVELHRVREGQYPATLDELKFTGQWDEIHINAVAFCSSADGESYFVEVQRGWMGKPVLTPNKEFWNGTGFDPALGPCPEYERPGTSLTD